MHFKEIFIFPGLPSVLPGAIKFVNKVIRRLGFHWKLESVPNPRIHMHTIEQRMNFMHLADRVGQQNIQGKWIETGCYTGQSAMVIQKVLQEYHPQERIVLFDHFGNTYGEKASIKEILLNSFRNHHLNDPELVEGDFHQTIPASLPDKIAFVHIDCGYGGPADEHRDTMLHLLNNIYPRMEKGSIMMFMDYHDPVNTIGGDPINPGVKLACDIFFKDKPERIQTLYGNNYSHAYLIKQ